MTCQSDVVYAHARIITYHIERPDIHEASHDRHTVANLLVVWLQLGIVLLQIMARLVAVLCFKVNGDVVWVSTITLKRMTSIVTTNIRLKSYRSVAHQ